MESRGDVEGIGGRIGCTDMLGSALLKETKLDDNMVDLLECSQNLWIRNNGVRAA